MLIQPPWKPQDSEAKRYLSYNWHFCRSCHADIPKTTGSTSDLQRTSGVLTCQELISSSSGTRIPLFRWGISLIHSQPIGLYRHTTSPAQAMSTQHRPGHWEHCLLWLTVVGSEISPCHQIKKLKTSLEFYWDYHERSVLFAPELLNWSC